MHKTPSSTSSLPFHLLDFSTTAGKIRRKILMETTMPRWAVKAILLTVIISVPLRCVSVSTNHTVGGPTGWDLSSNIQAWSATTTFHVGDSLVFTYTPIHDVLEVNELEYTTCLTVNPISVHNNGDTVVPLIEPGTRYFICGRNGHCALGLKFRVDVLPRFNANVSRRSGRPPHSAPPPSPPQHHPPPPPQSPDIDVPPTPDFPEPTHSPGPCGNSAAGGMIADWFFDCWWVPLFTTLMVSSLPRLSIA